MALDFAVSTTDRVDHGSGSSVTGLSALSILALINADALTTGYRILTKTSSTGGISPWHFRIDGTSSFAFAWVGSSNNLARSNSGFLSTGSWYWVGATTDKTNAPILYTAALGSKLAEPTYLSQAAGSSLAADSSSYPLLAGNDAQYATAFRSFDGKIAFVCLYNKVLSLPEMIIQQGDISRPFTSGCVLFCHYGIHGAGGVGTQIDWSGQGNHGTITGATYAAGAPIPIHKRSIQMPYVVAAGGADPEGSLLSGKLIRGGLLKHGVLVGG